MRGWLAVFIVVVGAGCGAAEDTASPGALSRYGIHAYLPAGWDGRIGRGALDAANFPLPSESTGWLRSTSAELAANDVLLLLFEHDRGLAAAPADPPAPELAGPLRLAAADFDPTDGVHADGHGHGYARRLFSLSGRDFVLFVETGATTPSAETLAETNQLLASLRVEAGDFYRGKLEPARFPDRAGWSVGASGAREARADADWLTSWAATVPYLDEWYSWPQKTLHGLPRNGVLLWLTLQRGNRFPPDPHGNAAPPEREPPFHLDDFERRASWEGQVRDLPEYILWGTVRGEYQVDLRVYFGQPEPTDAMRDEAQTMLDGLRLPEWGPWELDEAR
jgi:hypothetical protein